MAQKRKSGDYDGSAKRLRLEDRGHGLSNSTHNEPSNGMNRFENGELPILPPIKEDFEQAVFTHSSRLSAEDNTNDLLSYDRLEFLGDAYIEVIASRLIWSSFEKLPTGRLSQIREMLVKNEALSELSMLYGFDKRLSIVSTKAGEAKTWMKTKADVFEAYIAAIVLSDPLTGFEVAEEWLTNLWLPKLKDVNPSASNLKAKEKLAQKVMAKGIKLNYVEERPAVRVKGQSGITTYFMGVYLTGWGWENQILGSGRGLNKIAAGNDAAARAMENQPLIDEIVAKRTAFLEARVTEKPDIDV